MAVQAVDAAARAAIDVDRVEIAADAVATVVAVLAADAAEIAVDRAAATVVRGTSGRHSQTAFGAR